MRFLKYTLTLALLFFVVGKSMAQPTYYGSISLFEVLPSYLQNGKIAISTGSTTIVKYKIKFNRVVQDTYPGLTFKPFNMTIRLTTTSGTNIINIGESFNFTSSIFSGNELFTEIEITDEITNSQLVTGSNIILAYKSPDMQAFAAYSGKEYGYTTGPPPVTYYSQARTGLFTKNNCGIGYTSTPVSYTYPDSLHSSIISQADADSQATTPFNTNGQANANAVGICVPACSSAPSNIAIINFRVTPYPDEPKSKVLVTATNLSGVTYNWYVDGVFWAAGETNGRAFEFPNDEEHYIEVEAVNPCGVSNKVGRWKLAN